MLGCGSQLHPKDREELVKPCNCKSQTVIVVRWLAKEFSPSLVLYINHVEQKKG